MSKLFGKIAGFFSNRTLVGVDKAGNRYFFVKEEIDGIMKEKRWVVFKGEDDPTSIPVEWICWLNGQRKKAPTPEEMMELEARRERVRQNVALLKKEEMERNSKEGKLRKIISTGQVMGPDLKSFIRQVPTGSEGAQDVEGLPTRDTLRNSNEKEPVQEKPIPESSEPVGSGHTFRPGTWQPPT
ncbi:NDUFA12 domain-containing protein [Cucumis melo var. makuwa]|uniref:NADH dehydrogenase [ubiquinone] 1 alpha subcomplex subunit 12 n=2 Tax=Cucumis melo TaxID=3656 RepID=A0A5A7SS01_CUCMM|nr:uncharacterized protein LOC103501624 isoform X2 [Cucumis melo]KAA0033972.1 NDUFA12 domain-containing protein [Cucumis melo var. makuwa]